MKVEVLEGSVLRDEAAVQERLKAQMPELLRRAAESKVPLVRETARRQTRLFIENWFVKVRFQGAPVELDVLDVAFADERTAPPVNPEKSLSHGVGVSREAAGSDRTQFQDESLRYRR